MAASPENVAFSALLFLYHEVLHFELPVIEKVGRAKRPARLLEVFSREEARASLLHGERTPRLMPSLLYGNGLRLMEGVRLRVNGVDVAGGQSTVREGKGQEDRVTRPCISWSGWRIGSAAWRSGSRV
jgi:site-specific recombinase XerD